MKKSCTEWDLKTGKTIDKSDERLNLNLAYNNIKTITDVSHDTVTVPMQAQQTLKHSRSACELVENIMARRHFDMNQHNVNHLHHEFSQTISSTSKNIDATKIKIYITLINRPENVLVHHG